MRRGSSHRFSIETPDASVTAAVERAMTRVAAPRGPAYLPAERAWIALAALATGDHDAGRDTVRLLGDRGPRATNVAWGEGDLPVAAGSIAEPSGIDAGRSALPDDALALYLLLAARCFVWTGDHALLLDEWPRIERAAALGGRSAEAAASSMAIRGAALRELAVAAADIGHPADAARLGGAARGQAASGARIDPAVALVLGGSASPDVIAEWLNRCLRLSADGTSGPGGTIESAMLIAALVHGVLGAEPDAARQRLALRPCLPDGWTRLRVQNLHVGDAVVAMRHTTDGARATFTFEQMAGAVPLRLAFEPALPTSALRAAEVDGRTAQLHTRPFHDRTVAPVQLVLDHERTISFEC